ncbi:MAG: hypothetical protein P9X22_08915 [Candidatus Zapsychrus exili]|nr:hypothetical protein [Candidatus Zapsychrus exili]
MLSFIQKHIATHLAGFDLIFASAILFQLYQFYQHVRGEKKRISDSLKSHNENIELKFDLMRERDKELKEDIGEIKSSLAKIIERMMARPK